jgi:uncharacterized protein
MGSLTITLCQEELELLPQKAIWWPARKCMLVADMHLGKINHFRKAGIPVPSGAANKNWETLVELVMAKKPDRLICIGDLFHSHYNYDWESLSTFAANFHQLSIELVTGNHDILSDHHYQRSRILLHRDRCQVEPFTLLHIPPDEAGKDEYILSGHLHPGIQLIGKGRQSITLPCFYFGAQQGLLPAFGAFTGLARITPNTQDQVYIIAENKVMAL